MDDKRIYGDVVDIDGEKVKAFYDRRAELITAESPYSSVLLGDQNPELALEQMRIEKDILYPKMKIDEHSRVLDIGCGVGRWAEKVIPICEHYYGVDFSQAMIDAATERMSRFSKSKNYQFERMSFQELAESDCKRGFNRVIISGVLLYICDDDIINCLSKILKLFEEACIVFSWESCGIGRRLTVKDLPSDALGENYSAIYRTKAEYDELFTELTNNGFISLFFEYYSKLGGTALYEDTDKLYYIFERR